MTALGWGVGWVLFSFLSAALVARAFFGGDDAE